MKRILIILGLFASVTTFAQSPRIKLNQITKDTVKGSVLISSPSDSGMVYSRDFYVAYGADTVLILYGDTISGGGGLSSVLTDNVTITGDGSVGNPLKVDTATVISTIQGLVDTLAARGYLTTNQTITLTGDVTGSGTTAITATVVDDSHNHIISNVDFLQDSLDAKANDSDLANYVTLSGTETITGAKTFTNAFTQSGGDANFDNNTLYVDATTNRVGIGTSSPNKTLHVVGQARVANSSPSYSAYPESDLLLLSGGSSGRYGISIGNHLEGGSTKAYFHYDRDNLYTVFGSGSTPGGSNPVFLLNSFVGGTEYDFMRVLADGEIQLKVSGSEKLVVKPNGNVGIGTSSPEAPLHVYKSFAGVDTVAKIGGNAGYVTINNYGDLIGVGINSGVKSVLTAAWTSNTAAFGTTSNSKISVVTNSLQRMTVDNTGNVGIGTTSPSYQLQLSTNSAAKPTSSTWTIASDIRIKKNIVEYNKGLDVIMQINPIEYDYNGLGGFEEGYGGIGIIAQELKPILPEAINSYKAKLNPTDDFETDIMNFDSHPLTFVFINAIQEQQAIIETQASEIDQLKTLITDLTNRIQILENK